jgi:YVTN family beta-propeller protein
MCASLVSLSIFVVLAVVLFSVTPFYTAASLQPSIQKKLSVGDAPLFVLYDNANHFIYVANSGTSDTNAGTVSVINGTRIVTTIGQPAFRSNAVLTGAAYDPATKMVYVSDLTNKVVYVISGTKVVSTIKDPKLKCPGEIGFDPLNNFVVVSNNCELANTNTVSIISGNQVVREVQMSSAKISTPLGIAFAGDKMFVANFAQNNVSVLNAETFKMIGSISVGSEPSELAFDPNTLRMYVTNFGSNSVIVIDTQNLKVLSTIAVGVQPIGITFSPHLGLLYVANSGSNTVSILSNLSVTKAINAGTAPSRLAVDLKNNILYVADSTDPGFVTLIK